MSTEKSSDAGKSGAGTNKTVSPDGVKDDKFEAISHISGHAFKVCLPP